MKKLANLFIAIFAICSVATACADNDKPIRFDQLPATAKQFIEQHFADSKVMFAKMETDFLKKSYEVLFADGNQIEFDGDGNWKEIDCKYSAVPAAAIPTPIAEYVTANYPNTKVLKIEKDYREYEVKLSNRIELSFDLKFNLIDIDM